MKTAFYGNQKVLDGMREHWLARVGPAESVKSRTPKQEGWDSAILTCIEYMRRLGHDEKQLVAMFDLCTLEINN